ncbi:MAG: type 1 glutamine amidotransferase [Planctomycetes bacterium]|nr:type 1 glutamine amidotransferase [Planctomycetota bacterium]
MAHIGILQHFWCEGADALESALLDGGHKTTLVKLWDSDPVPAAGDFDAWLVMGGPMNVDETDRHAYLLAERKLLGRLIAADRPVIGVCLGAQLLARAAGARVYAKRPREIGLFDIELTDEAADDPLFSLLNNPQEVFQWHGDTFDLPPGAVHLARSRRFENQAFRLGWRVYGLQFHVECTLSTVQNIVKACERELAELPPQDRFEQFVPRLPAALEAQQALARKMIERWVERFN